LSQPLCFNLFGYQGEHPATLLRWVQQLSRDSAEEGEVALEWHPPTTRRVKYTHSPVANALGLPLCSLRPAPASEGAMVRGGNPGISTDCARNVDWAARED